MKKHFTSEKAENEKCKNKTKHGKQFDMIQKFRYCYFLEEK